MKKRETRLISAFPGTGKSYYFKQKEKSKKKVLDSDSSTFDKSDFPANYIKHIKENLGKVDVIFISSHKEVREALVKEELEFDLIYPKRLDKKVYIQRYIDRESPQEFIDLLSNFWDEWITECQGQRKCNHIILETGQYITDILNLSDKYKNKIYTLK